VLDTAFGEPSPGLEDRLAEYSSDTLVVEVEGLMVGTVRVTREQDTGRIYGLAVDPAWQGRGIGRDVLRRVCRELQAQGVRQIGLEVAVDNDHALRLYTSLGFELTITEDYYELPV
jgi:ribosomal protein S18 acetylase RimI-like enzyme